MKKRMMWTLWCLRVLEVLRAFVTLLEAIVKLFS
jgi:hypothetical protein